MDGYGEETRPPLKVVLDMDAVRSQMSDLAREFAILLRQELRTLSNADETKKTSPSTPLDPLSTERIDQILGGAGSDAILTEISGKLDTLYNAVQPIAGAIAQQQNGGGS